MKILKVGVGSDGGTIFKCDAIEHEGKLWLVPEWLDGTTKGTVRPARIICLRDLPIENPGAQYRDVHWELRYPLNRDILEGRRLSRKPRVIPEPDIILNETGE